MKTNISKLHDLFFNEKERGRREGHTTLFAWQLIGIAGLDCFSYEKTNQPVFIPFNKPVAIVMDTIMQIQRLCVEERIPFSINQMGTRFIIYGTAFDFYEVDDIPFDQPVPPPLGYSHWFSSREDNDLMWRLWEMNNETIQESMIKTMRFCNISGTVGMTFDFSLKKKSYL